MRFVLVVLMVGLATAQDVTKLVEVRYRDATRIALIPNKLVEMRVDLAGKYIIFQGDAKLVNSMEELVRKIDVPMLNVEFTFELIVGSKSIGKATELPVALSSVAKEMKNLFGFQTVTLMDTVTFRAEEGKEAEASGILPLMTEEKSQLKAMYNVRVRQVGVNGEKGSRLIRIGDLKFGGKIPMYTGNNGSFNYTDTGLSTGLDVKEGQRVVVGKIGLDSSSNPFFLVVSAKVVE